MLLVYSCVSGFVEIYFSTYPSGDCKLDIRCHHRNNRVNIETTLRNVSSVYEILSSSNSTSLFTVTIYIKTLPCDESGNSEVRMYFFVRQY